MLQVRDNKAERKVPKMDAPHKTCLGNLVSYAICSEMQKAPSRYILLHVRILLERPGHAQHTRKRNDMGILGALWEFWEFRCIIFIYWKGWKEMHITSSQAPTPPPSLPPYGFRCGFRFDGILSAAIKMWIRLYAL